MHTYIRVMLINRQCLSTVAILFGAGEMLFAQLLLYVQMKIPQIAQMPFLEKSSFYIIWEYLNKKIENLILKSSNITKL